MYCKAELAFNLFCVPELSLGIVLGDDPSKENLLYFSATKCSNLNPISSKLSSERGMVKFSDINEN